MKANKERELYSSKFKYSKDGTMVSYVYKHNKSVILISSQHTTGIVEGVEENFKPEILLYYNENKAGVDLLDRMTNDYTVQRGTCRWTMALFYNYLDLMVHNAYITWSSLHPNSANNTESRKEFIKTLVEDLIRDQISTRIDLGFSGVHENVRKPIEIASKVLQIQSEEAEDASSSGSSDRGRCYIGAKRRRSRSTCTK